jgi:hypothetical protein
MVRVTYLRGLFVVCMHEHDECMMLYNVVDVIVDDDKTMMMMIYVQCICCYLVVMWSGQFNFLLTRVFLNTVTDVGIPMYIIVNDPHQVHSYVRIVCMYAIMHVWMYG